MFAGMNLASEPVGINAIIVHISAMTMSTVFLAFPGMQLLDVTGPGAVLGAANDLLGRQAYDILVASRAGGSVASSCGLAIATQPLGAVAPANADAFFIPGGDDEARMAIIADEAMREWASKASATARRFGSICSGSIVLAAWDLIGDRRFASHWAAAPWFARHRPALQLDAEAIYVEDGRLWTSAGVTTGIDMALAIVEHDHGSDAARAIAQRFVLSVRRPGTQSQFSPLLAAQAGRDGRYRDLIGWIALNLDQPLDVETLAARVGESVRSFHRNFSAATGQAPAGFVTRLKLDRARDLIASGQPLKSVAQATGYPHVARLSAAFQRQFGMTASAYRIMHG